MKLFVVSYDLNKKDKDYKGLYEELKRFKWWHYLDSTWLLHTDESAEQIFDRLKPHIDNDDYILIIEANKDSYYGWLPKKAWEWFDSLQHQGSTS